MKNSILALISVLALLYACKKDDTTVAFDNYGNLEPGNYWLYDRYYLDSDSVLTQIPNVTDSNYVEKDTLINGKIYHKMMVAGESTTGNSYTPHFLRDSLHYLVDWQGTIRFSSENFPDTLATSYQLFHLGTLPKKHFIQSKALGSPAGVGHKQSCMQVSKSPATSPSRSEALSKLSGTVGVNTQYRQSTLSVSTAKIAGASTCPPQTDDYGG